jgi:hypothetical protein
MALPAFLQKIMGKDDKKAMPAKSTSPAAKAVAKSAPAKKTVAKKTVAKATTRMPKKK